MVLGAGVGGVGACPPAGEDWYVGVGIEGALGSLAMLPGSSGQEGGGSPDFISLADQELWCREACWFP